TRLTPAAGISLVKWRTVSLALTGSVHRSAAAAARVKAIFFMVFSPSSNLTTAAAGSGFQGDQLSPSNRPESSAQEAAPCPLSAMRLASLIFGNEVRE